MQSMWQAGTINQKVFEDFRRVKSLSNNRLDIEALAVGTIVAYTETLDAMQQHPGRPPVGRPRFSAGPALALIGDLNGGYDNLPDADVVRVRRRPRTGARICKVRHPLCRPGLVGRGSVPARSRAPGRLQGREMRVPEAWAPKSGAAPGPASSPCRAAGHTALGAA
jgi:hypothetical protein